jgi:hypothetical protein
MENASCWVPMEWSTKTKSTTVSTWGWISPLAKPSTLSVDQSPRKSNTRLPWSTIASTMPL